MISLATALGAGALLIPPAVASDTPAAAAIGPEPAGDRHQSHPTTHPAGGPLATSREAALHDQMRKLWEDHITWTRLAIVTFAADSPGFDATAARLLQNQTDIGQAIRPYYGPTAAATLTVLLRDHITIAVDILRAAKAADTDAVTAATSRWYANADDIADFLAAANPRWWPRREMRAAMKAHLDQTLAEATHELTGEYADSVADYEEIHHHILAMADQLSSGIVRQFPHRFR